MSWWRPSNRSSRNSATLASTGPCKAIWVGSARREFIRGHLKHFAPLQVAPENQDCNDNAYGTVTSTDGRKSATLRPGPGVRRVCVPGAQGGAWRARSRTSPFCRLRAAMAVVEPEQSALQMWRKGSGEGTRKSRALEQGARAPTSAPLPSVSCSGRIDPMCRQGGRASERGRMRRGPPDFAARCRRPRGW